MKKKLRLLALTFLVSGAILQITHAESTNPQAAGGGLPGVTSIAALDRLANLHFVIMSDHKGDSPLSSVEFAPNDSLDEKGKPRLRDRLG